VEKTLQFFITARIQSCAHRAMNALDDSRGAWQPRRLRRIGQALLRQDLQPLAGISHVSPRLCRQLTQYFWPRAFPGLSPRSIQGIELSQLQILCEGGEQPQVLSRATVDGITR